MDSRFPYQQATQWFSSEEIVVAQTGTLKYILPNNDFLENKKIIGISMSMQNASDNKKSPQGRTLVGLTAVPSGYLTIKKRSTAILDRVPLDFLVYNTAQGYFAVLIPEGYDPNDSYVEFFCPSTELTANETVLLHFHYTA